MYFCLKDPDSVGWWWWRPPGFPADLTIVIRKLSWCVHDPHTPGLPAAPQSAQVPLPGFSTSVFTCCRFVTWSEVIMMEGSALILLPGARKPRTPAHRAEATFESCSVISELSDNEAWCSLHAVKSPVSGFQRVVRQWHPQRSLRCRKRVHDAPRYTHLLSRSFLFFLHHFPLGQGVINVFIILQGYHTATERKLTLRARLFKYWFPLIS